MKIELCGRCGRRIHSCMDNGKWMWRDEGETLPMWCQGSGVRTGHIPAKGVLVAMEERREK